MTLMSDLRSAIKAGMLPPIFNSSDLQSAEIPDPNNNLSNYDKKNAGAGLENALVSRKINGEVYYSFDEEVLAKLAPGNALDCKEDSNGIRYYKNP